MPRMGRVVLPHFPHHVVQRGHYRQVVFTEEADFSYYLETVNQCRDVYKVKIYA